MVALQQSQLEKLAMKPEEVSGQIELIQAVMRRVMKEGEHYGKIPGTDKFTLLQPGAEKLILTFRLGTEFTVLKTIEEQDLISYTVRCDLFHIPTGNRVASGVGSCNSRESRYRYRYLPSDKRPSKAEADGLKLRGLGRWRKLDGNWVWHERIENDNPWDFQNTILKMAAKRAKVAATLNATAASDIFTQDVEDMDLGGLDSADRPASRPAEAAGQQAPAQVLPQGEVQPSEQPPAQPPAQPIVQAGDTAPARPERPARTKDKVRKDSRPAAEPAPAEAATTGMDLEALRRQVSEVMTLTRLELLWKDNAKTYEADPSYREIRKLFIDQRQFIQEAQAMEHTHGQGEAA
jgi:hypothetical protein